MSETTTTWKLVPTDASRLIAINQALLERSPTLRDQFAMAALGGFAAMVLDTSDDRIAAMAYTLADAMMKERQK